MGEDECVNHKISLDVSRASKHFGYRVGLFTLWTHCSTFKLERAITGRIPLSSTKFHPLKSRSATRITDTFTRNSRFHRCVPTKFHTAKLYLPSYETTNSFRLIYKYDSSSLLFRIRWNRKRRKEKGGGERKIEESGTHREEFWARRGSSIGSLRSGWPAWALASRGRRVSSAAGSSPVSAGSGGTRGAWCPPAWCPATGSA